MRNIFLPTLAMWPELYQNIGLMFPLPTQYDTLFTFYIGNIIVVKYECVSNKYNHCTFSYHHVKD